MIPYARLTPGKGFRPAQAVLYYAQRMTTPPVMRRIVSGAIASTIRLRHGRGPTSPRYPVAVASLRRQGIAMLPGLVPDVTDLVEYFTAHETVQRGPLAHYPLDVLSQSPAVMHLLNDPAILYIAGGYLGCKPTLSGMGCWWSFPAQAETAANQRFHRDPDDWRFLKLFVYLTDVGMSDGPHTYVRETHRDAASLRAKFWERSEIDQRYGDRVQTVTGPRGTAFIADTAGIHAGVAPRKRPRLILQAQYSLLPVYAFNYQPPIRSPIAVDRYVNRLLVSA